VGTNNIMLAALVVALSVFRHIEGFDWTYSYKFYNNTLSPTDWFYAWEDCAGFQQSPIDLSDSAVIYDDSLGKLKNTYNQENVKFENTGNTLKAEFILPDDLSSLTEEQYLYMPESAKEPWNLLSGGSLEDHEYYLHSIYFHSLSEHVVNGGRHLLEAHFVHVNLNPFELEGSRKYAVVGVLFEEGGHNDWLEKFVEKIPTIKDYDKANPPDPVTVTDVDPAKGLPKSDYYWTYDGSLTTPPCSEQVKWHVMRSSLKASALQLETFRNALNYNFRPLQRMDGRKIRTNDEGFAHSKNSNSGY